MSNEELLYKALAQYLERILSQVKNKGELRAVFKNVSYTTNTYFNEFIELLETNRYHPKALLTKDISFLCWAARGVLGWSSRAFANYLQDDGRTVSSSAILQWEKPRYRRPPPDWYIQALVGLLKDG